MALKAKAPEIDHARIDAIAASIAGTLSQFRLTNAELDDARDAAAQARAAQADSEAGHVNAREAIMGELARLSLAGLWTEPEIKLAASAAAKGNKVKADKAIETFMGEAKMAMDPKVRHQFATLLDIRDVAWDAEQDAIKIAKDTGGPAPAPIKKAFARKYHFLMAVLREVRSTGDTPDTVEDLVAWAKSMDPDLDAAKIKKRLDKIVEQLTAFNGDFPNSDIESCIGFLNDVSEADLTRARNDKLGVAAPAPAPVVAKPLPAAAARRAPAQAPQAAQAALDEAASIHNVAEGAASIDDLMDGFDGSVALKAA